MNKKVVEKAIDNLDGVAEIARNEMLVHNRYITKVVDEKMQKKGTVCGGRNACLIGSLYLAHGVPLNDSATWWNDDPDIEGVLPEYRHDFMRNRKGLKLSYNALNDAALRYMKKHHPQAVEDAIAESNRMVETWGDEPTWPPSEGYGEFLFESVLGQGTDYQETRKAILKVVSAAKRSLRNKYKDILN